MKKIKLLHIFSAPQSVYFFLDKQIQFLQMHNFEVHIILPNDGEYSTILLNKEKGVTFHFVPIKRSISILRDIYCLVRIYLLILKIKPDILHLHTPKASFLGALAGRLAFQKNIVYQMHGLVSANGNSIKKGLIYYLEKATCLLVDRIFAVSKSLMEFAVENKYCKYNKIKVVGNGTINGIDWQERYNPENLKKKPKQLEEIDIDSFFVVGFIGRICEDKGIEDFLTVVSRLQNHGRFLAVIVGPNEMGNHLKTLLQKSGMSHCARLIILEGIFESQDVIGYFDVLLFPSKREGFGLVAAEANSLMVPVVAYDIPGVRDAVKHNKTGKLVEFRNVQLLEKAVLDYYYDPHLKEEHGINGRKRVKALFSRQELWRNILQSYQKLVYKDEIGIGTKP